MSKQVLYAPRSEDNPWRVDTWMNTAEWKEVSRWYPFSLRSLMPDGRWYEHARCKVRDNASQIMKALAVTRPRDYFVIVQCTLVGNDGREKAVVYFPGSEQTISHERARRSLRAGIPSGESSNNRKRGIGMAEQPQEYRWTQVELAGILEMSVIADLERLISDPGRKHRYEFANSYALNALQNLADAEILPDDIRVLVQRILALHKTASDPFFRDEPS